MTTRFAEHGHVRVTKSVNRLLAIPDDENRWLKRAGVGDAGALSPRLDQKGYQLPLRPARVLELVDQDVVITRLEAVAALGELLHLPKEVERTKQHLREVEDGVGFKGSPVLGFRDGKHPTDATRNQYVEIAPVGGVGGENRPAEPDYDVALVLPVPNRRKLGLRIRHLLPRLTVLGEEVLAGAREHALKCCRVGTRTVLDRRRQLLQLTRQQEEGRLGRTTFDKALKTPWHGLKDFQKRCGARACHG